MDLKTAFAFSWKQCAVTAALIAAGAAPRLWPPNILESRIPLVDILFNSNDRREVNELLARMGEPPRYGSVEGKK
ncbi:MAG: hypothetical protein E4G96_10405 [Chrysiogenales bacterium]|nr:MAG: hypothetical protein E4G96_10405 [Chrysiogenales bacterium]